MEVQMLAGCAEARPSAEGGSRSPFAATLSTGPPPPPPPSSLLPVPRSRLVCSDFPCRPLIGRQGSGGGAQDPSSRSAALALAFSRPRSGSSSSVVGYGGIEVGKPCNVYRQRRMEAKRKSGVKGALQLPPSSSSVERTESIGKKLDKIRDGDGISKSGGTPSKRKQHPRLHQRDKPNSSLQDFIKQQRSYFAEIDAFELSEEEVAAAEASE